MLNATMRQGLLLLGVAVAVLVMAVTGNDPQADENEAMVATFLFAAALFGVLGTVSLAVGALHALGVV